MTNEINERALKTDGILTAKGEVDVNSLNVISGVYTADILAEMAELIGVPVIVENLYRKLCALYAANKLEALTECMRMLYVIDNMRIPDEFTHVMDSGNTELIQAFYYEVICDMEDFMFDYVDDDGAEDDEVDDE